MSWCRPNGNERGFSSVRWLDEFGVFSFALPGAGAATAGSEPPSNRDWFENAGILICRGAQTSSGLPVGVALKGGHNAEHHNHNDLGSYVFCIGDSMTLVDPGAEVYTRRTFSAQRYVSNVLNSFGHPVPRVAGQLQTDRSLRGSQGVEAASSRTTRTLCSSILASAYPVKTLKQLTRTFVFQRSSGSLTVTDEVKYDAPETFGTAVITFGAWKQVSADRLLVGEGATAVEIQIDAGGLPVKIEATTIDEDVHGEKQPTRIGIDLAEPVEQAVVRLTIAAGGCQAMRDWHFAC